MTEIGHNQTDRKTLIRDIKGEIDGIEADIATLMIARKKAKGRIKSDLGWKVADWNAMIRVVDLEEDARTELFSVMREGFNALEVGGQASFLDVIDPQPVTSEAAPAPKKKRKTKAEQIAEAILADTPSPAEVEIAEQKAADDAEFETQTDIEDFVESEEALETA